MTKAEMREHTCCFTGHRKISQTELGNVKQELRKAIIRFYRKCCNTRRIQRKGLCYRLLESRKRVSGQG